MQKENNFYNYDSSGEQLSLFLNLDGFEGPIDLLLHLSREQKVDLTSISIAELANQYIDFHKPWELNKNDDNSEDVKKIASTAINLFRILNLYLEPVIPETSEKIKNYLKSNQSLDDLSTNLINHQIDIFKPLMFRIEDAEITKLNEISQNG